jgi:hypothetical protein
LSKVIQGNVTYINRLIFGELLKRIFDSKKSKAHHIWNPRIIDFKKIYPNEYDDSKKEII